MQMPNLTEAGRIFIREGTQLPEALQLESEPYTAGWRLVKNLDWHGLGRKLHEAGWTFSCTAGEINVTVFGLDEQNTVRRAIARTLANARPEKFNSLEITRVATAASKRFAGGCYVTASARSRYIQESTVLLAENAVRPPRQGRLSQSQPERSVAPMHKYLEANSIELQMQAHSRKTAIERWTKNKGQRKGQRKVRS
jgi:hypothetical protein